ncbi:MAG TPA: B12-binding domain-containing radical SAM protein [Desulfotomaculum sp.]|nr:B12-binding domain-containing radical SAM protein [Desulfotomaculum sp.]
MRVLLIQPRPRDGLGFKSVFCTEPLGLEIVGAALKEHQVSLWDMLDETSPANIMAAFRPQAVGLSCSFTVDVYTVLNIAQVIKEITPATFTFVGGHHASLCPKDFFHPSINAIVTGEGETTTPEMLAALEGNQDLTYVAGLVLNLPEGQFITKNRAPLAKLDDVPLPDRLLTGDYQQKYYLGFRRPVAAVETSRGCPYRCNFCSVWRFHQGKVRTMSPLRVVEEISRLKANEIFFTDDNFLADIQRAGEIAHLIRKQGLHRKNYIFQARSDTIVNHPDVVRQWKEAGLDHLFIGFEKIDEEGLKQVNKHNSVENNENAFKFLKSLGIGVYASFIVDPGFTAKEFQKLLVYIKRLRIKQPYFSVLTPLPGTELFSQLKSRLTTVNYEFFDLLHAVLPTNLPLQEFYHQFTNLYKQAYRKPEHLFGSMQIFFQKLLNRNLSFNHLSRLIYGAKQTLNWKAYLKQYDS